jgi:glycosyltransferase involved in cell wall biosynthesis
MVGSVRDVVIVVPCHNEAARLLTAGFLRLLQDPGVRLLFVDDGSTDPTHEKLAGIRALAPDAVEILRLPANRGKAEAVRQGLLHAAQSGSEILGYCDADLATPADEMLRLLEVMRSSRAIAVLGARVRLLGSRIERSPLRHYLGRLFATLASLVLRLAVYDTQCGAKVFRATPTLLDAIRAPFSSRWAFDVELIARLLAPPPAVPAATAADFIEVPLGAWRDVQGSKLSAFAMLGAAIDLAAIGIRLSRARRARGG